MTSSLCAGIYTQYFPSVQLSLMNFSQFPLSLSKTEFRFFPSQIYYVFFLFSNFWALLETQLSKDSQSPNYDSCCTQPHFSKVQNTLITCFKRILKYLLFTVRMYPSLSVYFPGTPAPSLLTLTPSPSSHFK